jgi:hypothetical protein
METENASDLSDRKSNGAALVLILGLLCSAHHAADRAVDHSETVYRTQVSELEMDKRICVAKPVE